MSNGTDDEIDVILSPGEVKGTVDVVYDEDGTPFLELIIGDETITLPVKEGQEFAAKLSSLPAADGDLISAKKPS
jgi:hypothetical protein